MQIRQPFIQEFDCTLIVFTWFEHRQQKTYASSYVHNMLSLVFLGKKNCSADHQPKKNTLKQGTEK